MRGGGGGGKERKGKEQVGPGGMLMIRRISYALHYPHSHLYTLIQSHYITQTMITRYYNQRGLC